MTDDEKDKKLQEIRELAKAGKIRWPSRERIKELDPYVRQVLKAIGVKGALVTDLSTLGDFWGLWFHPDDDLTEEEKDKIEGRELALIAYRLGLDEVSTKDYIYAVAERLRDKGENTPVECS